MIIRLRLPNRRKSVTEDIVVGNVAVTTTIGFDDAGAPREVFLTAGKSGAELPTLLTDAAVVISVALQHGVKAAALGKSVGRLPIAVDGPGVEPASALGAVLDLLSEYEF